MLRRTELQMFPDTGIEQIANKRRHKVGSMARSATTLLIFTAVSLLDLTANSASASIVVDQLADAFTAPNPSGELGGPSIADFQTALQTFTVGTGGNLASVELQVQQSGSPSIPTDDLVVSILGTTGGVPDFNQDFGSVSLPPASITAFNNFTSAPFVSFDVSGLGIAVSPGDVLAIAASYPTGTGSYFVWDAEVDIYAGGTSFISNPLDGSFFATTRDLGFRTSVAVPEQSTFPLYFGFIAGLCVCGYSCTFRASVFGRRPT